MIRRRLMRGGLAALGALTTGSLLGSLHSAHHAHFESIAPDRFSEVPERGRPGSLPIEEVPVFDLVPNLTAAQKTGVSLPDSVMRRATKIVE